MSETLRIRGRVRRVDPAPPATAVAHFAARLTVETDCSDVWHDLEAGGHGIVVVDTRSAEAFAEARVPGAVHLAHGAIDRASASSVIPDGAVAVTYCWGPHCNAATQGALRLAELGYPVKEMIGGFDYWRRDGYPVASGPA